MASLIGHECSGLDDVSHSNMACTDGMVWMVRVLMSGVLEGTVEGGCLALVPLSYRLSVS